MAKLRELHPQSIERDADLADVKRAPGTPSLHSRDGKTVVEFSLAHTSVVANVRGNVARVEVTQLYQNPSANRLEAVYQFPLPENAAVTDMMFRIGRRVVVSEVKPRAEARRAYDHARLEGQTAALTEEERPNLFTQSVANIPPGESVEVVIRYTHEVKFDDGRYQFVFPTTVGPRYVPGHGVADAERITPPVVAPGVASAHDLDIVVELEPAASFTNVAAKSHRLLTAVDPARGTRLIAVDGDHVPNKDFILSYAPLRGEPDARVLTANDRGDDFLMLFMQPPADVAPEMVRAKQMVFLLDTSGSMWGQPLETAKKVAARALHHMGPDDTFELIGFDSSTKSMSPAPLASSPENIAAAEKWLATLQGSGGTEMLAGIKAALDLPSDPKRLRMVVFCTDGFIGNEREIIDYIDKSRGTTRVFGFGIGPSVNRYLIEGVARAGRGAAEVVQNGEPVDDVVKRLYKRLDRPVLTDVSLSFSGIAVKELLPARMPDLFAGQPLVVVGKFTGQGKATVELRGQLGAKPFARTLSLDLRTGDTDPLIGTLWARRRIEELSHQSEGGANHDEQGQIVALGMKYKLITPYTSFVAVDKQLKLDTNLPLSELVVPNELPEGVSYQGIFDDGVVNANAEITPSRVKPGDPEIRVQAPSDARVEVALPWRKRPLVAVWDAPSREFVGRFLVPAGWPDGRAFARVTVERSDGSREQRSFEIHVDTKPAAIAVVDAPATVRPGEELHLALKPALPLSALGKATSLDAVKSAIDVKEIFVRAPWGEDASAKMEGPLGIYRATLHVPRSVTRGKVELQIVAADTAGNLSRRLVAVDVSAAPSTSLAAAAGLMLLALSALLVRRQRARGIA